MASSCNVAMEVGSAGLGGCESNPEVSLSRRLPAVCSGYRGQEPPWFSLAYSAPRTTPPSQAGARFEQVVACWAARRLSPAGGTTHIYLRPALAQPAIR